MALFRFASSESSSVRRTCRIYCIRPAGTWVNNTLDRYACQAQALFAYYPSTLPGTGHERHRARLHYAKAAAVLMEQGDLAGARPLYERALAIRKKANAGHAMRVLAALATSHSRRRQWA